MRNLAILFLFFTGTSTFAQTNNGPYQKAWKPCEIHAGSIGSNDSLTFDSQYLLLSMNTFHDRLITGPFTCVSYLVHDSLSYGHSNGWIESKEQLIGNLNTGYIIYHSFNEDSVRIVREGDMATIRFLADIEATLNGKRSTFHLKVLEVWVKKNESWLLLSRQAVKG